MPRRNQGCREYHTKSRNGCIRCKQRRVKCNRQAPQCSNCIRRGETCVYRSEISTYFNAPHPGQQTVSRAPTYSPVPQFANFSQIIEAPISPELIMKTCLSEAFLSHHVSTDERTLWHHALVKHMSGIEYLRHALLSLCSLRNEAGRYTENPDRRPFAYQHHFTASRLFQATSPAVSDDNWIAVLIFGISVVIFHLATQQTCLQNEFDYIEALRVLRITRTLATGVAPFLFKSNLWPFIEARINETSKPIDSATNTAVRNLETVVLSVQCDDNNLRVYLHAFYAFKEWVVECDSFPRTWRHYIQWAAMVPEEFIALLSWGDDTALLILIHWCTVLHLGPRRWFLELWPRRTAVTAMSKLSGDWGDVLSWSRGVFKLDQIPVW